MLSSAHAPTGALIATKIPNPFISIPLILLSHYIEDRIPHWDVGQGMGTHSDRRRKAFLYELFLDLPLSVILVYFLFQYKQPEINVLAWIGWFVALLPDFLDFPINFLKIRLPPLVFLHKAHELIHRSTTNKIAGLIPQILVIIIVYLLR